MPNRTYRGPDRRLNRVYVTRNTEYHFRGDVCVAVRDRNTGKWDLAHSALNRELCGSVRFEQGTEPFPSLGEPRVGDALFFGSRGPDVITSVLTSVGRPAKTVVHAYPI